MNPICSIYVSSHTNTSLSRAQPDAATCRVPEVPEEPVQLPDVIRVCLIDTCCKVKQKLPKFTKLANSKWRLSRWYMWALIQDPMDKVWKCNRNTKLRSKYKIGQGNEIV